jgi:heptosyltransferase-1
MAKILIVRLGAMGDILHALPAVTAIRAAMPEARIGWLVEEKWTELLAAQGHSCPPDAVCKQKPIVNFIHTINTRRLRERFFHPTAFVEIRALLRTIRGAGYDVALDFQGAIKSAFLASISKASAKAGFVNPREPAARFFYSQKFSRSGEHVIEQNFGLAAEAIKKNFMREDLKLLAPELPHDPAAEAWAEAEIRRLGAASFAMMNPGAGWGAKQWPSERYGQVAQALALHNIKTLVNAAAGEEPLAKAVIGASNNNASLLACTIGQLIAITRRARLFIGGDTGPLHLATALGIPVVGLFGPTDPARTGPFGTQAVALRHAESKTTFSHHEEPEQGLLKITVEETVAAARHLLGSARA